MRHIDTLGGLQSSALAINDWGQVFGASTTAGGAAHAILWQHGTLKDLGMLAGDPDSKAVSSVTAGVAVGSSWGGSSNERAVVFDSRGVTALPSPAGAVNPSATAINRNGTVVGWYQTTGDEQPVLWDASGAHPLLPAGQYGQALAINGFGKVGTTVVVVPSQNRSTTHAALFGDGRAIDLQKRIPADSGWRLRSADGINDQGMIVGYGLHNGVGRGFLLVPVS